MKHFLAILALGTLVTSGYSALAQAYDLDQEYYSRLSAAKKAKDAVENENEARALEQYNNEVKADFQEATAALARTLCVRIQRKKAIVPVAPVFNRPTQTVLLSTGEICNFIREAQQDFLVDCVATDNTSKVYLLNLWKGILSATNPLREIPIK